jgi:hypothetical protein
VIFFFINNFSTKGKIKSVPPATMDMIFTGSSVFWPAVFTFLLLTAAIWTFWKKPAAKVRAKVTATTVAVSTDRTKTTVAPVVAAAQSGEQLILNDDAVWDSIAIDYYYLREPQHRLHLILHLKPNVPLTAIRSAVQNIREASQKGRVIVKYVDFSYVEIVAKKRDLLDVIDCLRGCITRVRTTYSFKNKREHPNFRKK